MRVLVVIQVLFFIFIHLAIAKKMPHRYSYEYPWGKSNTYNYRYTLKLLYFNFNSEPLKFSKRLTISVSYFKRLWAALAMSASIFILQNYIRQRINADKNKYYYHKQYQAEYDEIQYFHHFICHFLYCTYIIKYII